jgi:nucleoside-diphosphate-sugar epimerase
LGGDGGGTVSAGVILVTGASGSLGEALAHQFAAAGEELHLLHHCNPVIAPRGARVHRGDLSLPDLGLSGRTSAQLRRRLTGILHCAGLTEFSISRAEGQHINVRATENLLRWAARAARIERIGLLSTVYVAGKRRGGIAEEELTHRAGFVNEYERSKYAMEQQALRFRKILPIAIYRLSTILGRENGEVVRWGAVHHALRLFFNGWIPMVPGGRDSTVDLISFDYATSSLEEFFLRRFEPGITCHIAAGRDGSLGLEAFLDLTARTFRSHDPGWSRRGIEPPPIVPLATFRRLEETVRKTGDLFFARVMDTMSRFVPQLAYPKTFEVEVTRRAGLAATPLRRWLPAVLRHCLASSWGGKTARSRMAEAG